MNAEHIKQFIDYLIKENLPSHQVVEMLRGEPTLDNDEKRLIYSYCYPRPLGDRELPSRVIKSRKSRGPNARNGFLTPDNIEIALIIEAGKTAQYERFIKHLMHSFSEPEKVAVISGTDVVECPICGKKLRELNVWNPEVDKQREHLAFGNPEQTSISLCLDCLIQLNAAKEIMDVIDPGYYDWTKRHYGIRGV